MCVCEYVGCFSCVKLSAHAFVRKPFWTVACVCLFVIQNKMEGLELPDTTEDRMLKTIDRINLKEVWKSALRTQKVTKKKKQTITPRWTIMY